MGKPSAEASSGHYGSEELDKLHRPIDETTEGGACLTGHLATYQEHKPKKTCNYRYQAHEHAKEEPIKGRLESYQTRQITAPVATTWYRTNKNERWPAEYCTDLPIPGPGDWDVEGPTANFSRTEWNRGDTENFHLAQVPKGQNFTTDTWPYWNNAHHLIPKATLMKQITAEKPPVDELIQQALLKAKYNINHKINMLLIPQDREVAGHLGLPRHLQLKETDATKLKSPCFDHTEYGKMVENMADSGLKGIIAQYRAICESADAAAQKAHSTPDPELNKVELENLSRTLLNTILGWGADPAKAGQSLAKLAKDSGFS